MCVSGELSKLSEPLEDRCFGTEMEWGLAIQLPSDSTAHWAKPIRMAEDERGFYIPLKNQVTELIRRHLPPDIQRIGAMTTLGGKMEEDEQHPETSTRECQDLIQLIESEEENEKALIAVFDAAVAEGDLTGYRLYNSVADGQGETWGAHESYQINRRLLAIHKAEGEHREKFDLLGLFLAVRGLLVGSGRVIKEPNGDSVFVNSQKAAHLDCDYSLYTVRKKPLINLRIEPHASHQYGRLHVTSVDPGMSREARWLAVGMMRIVITMLEAGQKLSQDVVFPPGELHKVARNVARDTTGRRPLVMANGHTIAPLEIHGLFVEAGHSLKRMGLLNGELIEVLDTWEQVWNEGTADITNLAKWNDWGLRLRVLEKYRANHANLPWSDPRVSGVDREYDRVDTQDSMGQRARRQLIGQNRHMPKKGEERVRPKNRADLRMRFVRAFAGRAALDELTPGRPMQERVSCDWGWVYHPDFGGAFVLSDPRHAQHARLEEALEREGV
jgi:hypothetical protein